jgi:hypothetical protein
MTLEALVGVYDADGSRMGEVAYWIGARLGRRHCALCDITHGAVWERRDWRQCAEALPVPFETHHRDDQPADIRVAAGDQAPVVVARTARGPVLLLGPADLVACDGSAEALVARIEEALGDHGLGPDAGSARH